MNRFHAHVHVTDIDANIRFYSQLFGASPTVKKPDYAKWMLEDPRVNFAISISHDNAAPGIAHLGLQAESTEALTEIGNRLKSADAITLSETNTTCCYAKSDKYWAVDPQGIHWETFHTHGEATHYFEATNDSKATDIRCCEPTKNNQTISENAISSNQDVGNIKTTPTHSCCG